MDYSEINGTGKALGGIRRKDCKQEEPFADAVSAREGSPINLRPFLSWPFLKEMLDAPQAALLS